MKARSIGPAFLGAARQKGDIDPVRAFFRMQWVTVLLLGGRLAAGGDEKPVAAAPSGTVPCHGYVVVSTQAAYRTVAVDDAAGADLALVEKSVEALDTEESGLMKRALSGIAPSAAGYPAPAPPAAARAPRRQGGDALDSLEDGLSPAPQRDPFRSWGWLAADVGQAERVAEQAAEAGRRQAGRDRMFSPGSDGSDLGGRRGPDRLPSFEDGE